jgi:CBS domain-containing protein
VAQRLRRFAGRLLAPALWAAGLILIVLGNALAGFSLVMAGWFARVAARAARRRDELERLIDGVTVGEVMETEAFVVAPQATLDTFADSLDVQGATTVARVMRDDHLLGIVGLRELARVPRRRWPAVHAGDAMSGADALPVLAPGDALRPAADRLGASTASGFPVLDDGRVAGILTRLAVGRVLHERSLRATGAVPAGPAPGGEA